MMGGQRRALSAVLMVSAMACEGRAQSARNDTLAGLSLVERPTAAGQRMALLITGDGGWAPGDRAIADQLVSSGMSVIGLDARAYLRAAERTPESVAADVARILEHYRVAWHRDSIVLVGYSRGADLLPFAISRMTPALRDRISLVALVSLAERASFEFHWQDLVRDIHRPTDIPVVPELQRIRGLRILCIGGEDEPTSACRMLDRSLATVLTHAGGHMLTEASGTAVGRVIVAESGRP